MQIIRIKEVLARTGKCRSAIYAEAVAGTFTPPIKIGARASGWPDYEVDEINAARVAGKAEADIKKLVVDLVNRRQGGERRAA